MVSVGIRELKAKLSQYLERVRDGEEILITDRQKEVALVIPISQERRAVFSLMDTGKATWSGGKPKGMGGVRVKRKSLTKTVLEGRR